MQIRAFQESDKDFIVSLALRFMDFELMSWRDPDKMEESQLSLAQESVDNLSPGTGDFCGGR